MGMTTNATTHDFKVNDRVTLGGKPGTVVKVFKKGTIHVKLDGRGHATEGGVNAPWAVWPQTVTRIQTEGAAK